MTSFEIIVNTFLGLKLELVVMSKLEPFKNLILSVLLSLTFTTPLISQKVFTTTHASQADAILYETKNKSEADILIYKVDYTSQVHPAKGLWYEVQYTSQAEWKIYWAKYKSQADCVVYFVKYRSQAKRNNCFLSGNCRK